MIQALLTDDFVESDASINQFLDPVQYLGGVVDGVLRRLSVVLVVRNQAVVDRVGVVELATGALRDELMQPARQLLQSDVVDARRNDDDVVTQRRNGVDAQLRSLQRFLRTLQHVCYARHRTRSVYKTRPIAIDGVEWSFCLSVCISGHVREHHKTAEPIEMPFGMLTRMGPRNHALDGVEIPLTERGNLGVKAFGVSDAALYAGKKQQRRQRDCGSRQHCSRLVGIPLYCPPLKIRSLRCGHSSKFVSYLFLFSKQFSRPDVVAMRSNLAFVFLGRLLRVELITCV